MQCEKVAFGFVENVGDDGVMYCFSHKLKMACCQLTGVVDNAKMHEIMQTYKDGVQFLVYERVYFQTSEQFDTLFNYFLVERKVPELHLVYNINIGDTPQQILKYLQTPSLHTLVLDGLFLLFLDMVDLVHHLSYCSNLRELHVSFVWDKAHVLKTLLIKNLRHMNLTSFWLTDGCRNANFCCLMLAREFPFLKLKALVIEDACLNYDDFAVMCRALKSMRSLRVFEICIDGAFAIHDMYIDVFLQVLPDLFHLSGVSINQQNENNINGSRRLQRVFRRYNGERAKMLVALCCAQWHGKKNKETNDCCWLKMLPVEMIRMVGDMIYDDDIDMEYD